MTAEDLNLGRRFKARPLNHSATLLNGRRKSIYGPYLLDLNSELMYCSQDYLGLRQSRMENWFTFSHLCSADFLSLSHLSSSQKSGRFHLEMGSVLWTRSAVAWSCPAPWPRLCQLSHLAVLPSNLAEHVPAPGLPATVSPGWGGPAKHSLLQGDKLAHANPSWQGEPPLVLYHFRSTETALLPPPTGLPQGLDCYHYKAILVT